MLVAVLSAWDAQLTMRSHGPFQQLTEAEGAKAHAPVGHGKGGDAEHAGKGVHGKGAEAEHAGKGAHGKGAEPGKRVLHANAPGEFSAPNKHAHKLPEHGALKHLDDHVGRSEHDDIKASFTGNVRHAHDSKVLERFGHLSDEFEEAQEEIIHELNGTSRAANALVLVIAVILALSVLVEWLMDFITEHVSDQVVPMIQSAFQELTVLGFISLFIFLVMLSGVLGTVSEQVFGMDDELKELFEQIHFVMFLFIMLFMGTVLIQMFVLRLLQRRRASIEVMVSNNAQDVEENYMRWSKTKINFFDFVSHYKRNKAVFAMEYMVTRLRFLQELDAKEMSIDGFNFAAYLAGCNVTALANVINIHPVTWLFLLFFLWPLRMFMAIQSISVKLLIIWSLGGLLCLTAIFMLSDLQRIRYQLHGVPRLGSRNAERVLQEALVFQEPGQSIADAILKLPPPYLRGNHSVSAGHEDSWWWRLVFGRAANRHENLLYLGANGKRLLFGILREITFLQSVYLAVIVIRFWRITSAIHCVLPFAFIVFPIMNVGYLFMAVLDQLSIVTSIGMMPNKEALRMELLSTKVQKLVNAMRLLNKLSIVSAATGGDMQVPARIEQIFRKAAPSGSMTGLELKALIPTLGSQYKTVNFNSIDDEWVLGLKEFAVLLQEEEQKLNEKTSHKQSAERITRLVDETWSKLDQDGSGAISSSEFIAYIQHAGGSSSSKSSKADELCAMMILKEADIDHDGQINKEELEHLLHKYSTL